MAEKPADHDNGDMDGVFFAPGSKAAKLIDRFKRAFDSLSAVTPGSAPAVLQHEVDTLLAGVDSDGEEVFPDSGSEGGDVEEDLAAEPVPGPADPPSAPSDVAEGSAPAAPVVPSVLGAADAPPPPPPPPVPGHAVGRQRRSVRI